MKWYTQIALAVGLGLKRHLHIFIALILGIGCGMYLHQFNTQYSQIIDGVEIIGQVFIRLIQMVIIPLVISAIVVGIASLGDGKQLGKIGLKMFFYYGIITLVAVTIGATLATTFNPGEHVQEFIAQADATNVQVLVDTAQKNQDNFKDIFLNLIPQNPIKSLAKGEMVPTIIFILIFGCAFAAIGDVNKPVVSFFESLFAATMKVTDWIMMLAAPGIFALTASAIAHSGIEIIGQMYSFIVILLIGFTAQMFFTYPLMLKIFSKVKCTSLYQAVSEAMLVAFGTASSSATLPVTMACCERRAGISGKICGFVIPLGATMNMDATAMFQTVAVIFIAQAYGVPLDMPTVITIAALAIVASSTSAGIPTAGMITIAIILNGIGLTPDQVMQSLGFLFAIDRILDMFRTMANTTSDTVVAAIIASNEGELDHKLIESQETWQKLI